MIGDMRQCFALDHKGWRTAGRHWLNGFFERRIARSGSASTKKAILHFE